MGSYQQDLQPCFAKDTLARYKWGDHLQSVIHMTYTCNITNQPFTNMTDHTNKIQPFTTGYDHSNCLGCNIKKRLATLFPMYQNYLQHCCKKLDNTPISYIYVTKYSISSKPRIRRAHFAIFEGAPRLRRSSES